MSDFVMITDSSADLTPELVAETGVEVLPLSVTIKNKTYHNYPDEREIAVKEFFGMLRSGEMATTAAVNVADYTEAMEPILASGRDILILAFSSNLSATYQSSLVAVSEMLEKYPERKIFTVDTLCASLGQGMLVYLACKERDKGRNIEEVRDWAEQHKLNLCHWFTVDDLNFLKRGGRVSAATALVGTMLSIKPVLHVDDSGRLISMGKARGRAASLKALVDHMEESALEKGDQTVFLTHGDCLEDAQKVVDDVKARFGVKKVYVNNVGPVVGAHSGPGTIALFFMGSKR
ncbi:DegV domain-containing protein [bioreactor metagenome]|uniref:DegV domain-containing protein n=1 Tax=bioreactor metagenome TaxID=1076179 RepID=A0A644WP51_9ZZZZ